MNFHGRPMGDPRARLMIGTLFTLLMFIMYSEDIWIPLCSYLPSDTRLL